MRRYLLDTAPVGAFLLGRPGALGLLSTWLTDHEAATSLVVYGEVIEFFKALPDFPRHRAALRTFMREVRPYALTYSILERYADLRRALRPPHGPGLVGDIDVLIAATAIERDLTLVTTDSDFQRVPELHVQVVPRASLSVR